MESAVYRQYYDLEATHWWFTGMRTMCRSLLERLSPLARDGSLRCLDIGCGTGLWTQELQAWGEVWGLDVAPEAMACCRARGIPRLIQGRAERLPFAAEQFDLVTLLGVIEHVEDDGGMLDEVARVCKPGGVVLLLTSAYRALWSRHDELVHHKRRYRKSEFLTLLRRHGFDVVKDSYVNTVLLPPIVAVRVIRWLLRGWRRRSATDGTPDMFQVPPAINRTLYGILMAERWWLRHGRLPFGVGLVAVAHRDG